MSLFTLIDRTLCQLVVTALVAFLLSSDNTLAQVQDTNAKVRLCGEPAFGSKRVLITAFRDAGNSATSQNGKKISYSVALALEDRRDLIVSVWDPDQSQIREHGRLMELLTEVSGQQAFQVPATPDTAKQQLRFSEEIRNFLVDNGCDIVVTGHLVQIGRITTVSAILIAPGASQNAFFSLGSSVDSFSGAPIRNSGQELADRIIHKILEVSPSQPTFNNIEVGCITIDNYKGAVPLGTLANAIRARIQQDLSYDARFKGRVELRNSAVCDNKAENAASDAQAIISATLTTSRKHFVVKPKIKVRALADNREIEVELRESGPYSYDGGVRGQFSLEIRRFLTSATTTQGEFPAKLEVMPTAIPAELLSTVDRLTQTGANEAAVVLGYYGLSKAPNDPVINLALGRALTSKKLPRVALEFLNRAQTGHRDLTDKQVDYLWETLSTAWLDAGTSETNLKNLRKIYDDRFRKNDTDQARRLTQNLALLMAQHGSTQEAYQLLLTRAEFHNSGETQTILGKLAALDHKHIDESILWLTRASLASPDERSIKEALVKVYTKRGNEYLDQADSAARSMDPGASQLYAKAQADLESAINIIPNVSDPELQYLAAYSSFRRGEFGSAALWYEKVVSAREFRWAESSWLGLIESLLLSSKYAEADKRAQDAIDSLLRTTPDSHLAALYMRYVARVLQSPTRSLDELRADEVNLEIQRLQKHSSISKLRWDGSLVLSFLEGKQIPQPARAAIDQVTQAFANEPSEPTAQNSKKSP